MSELLRPYRPRVRHKGHLVNENGDVSALCSKKPKAIDMRRASWAFRWDGVTCPRCLALRPPTERREA